MVSVASLTLTLGELRRG